MSDPFGLWSLTLSFYRGYGGAITVGYDSGKAFVTGDAGFGLGGGISFNPTGKFPRASKGEACGTDEKEGFIGFQGTAGLNFGPLGIGKTGYTGGNVYRDENGRLRFDFVEGSTPFGRLRQPDGNVGVGLQLSGGVRVGIAVPFP